MLWNPSTMRDFIESGSAWKFIVPNFPLKKLLRTTQRNCKLSRNGIFLAEIEEKVWKCCAVRGFAKCFDLFSQKVEKSTDILGKLSAVVGSGQNSLVNAKRRVGSEPKIYRLGCNHRWPRIRNFEITLRLCRPETECRKVKKNRLRRGLERSALRNGILSAMKTK